MKDDKLAKGLKNYATPNNILIGFVILGLILVFAVLIGQRLFSKDNEVLITEDQIMIQKGENLVIVNRNGLIEYRSKDGVFYLTWDSKTVNAFFESMEAKAKQYLENPVDEEGCYLVTLYVDGELVTVCISEDDTELNEVFEEFGFTPTPTLTPIVFIIPTLTPTPTSAQTGNLTPTPTPEGGDPPDVFIPPLSVCEQWAEFIVNKAVISNILCTKEEPQ